MQSTLQTYAHFVMSYTPTPESLRDDLLKFNRLLRDLRHLIPKHKHPSIPLSGFKFILPAGRNKSGTDELLARAQKQPVLGKARGSKSFQASFYWDNQHLYFPDFEESLEEFGIHIPETKGTGSGYPHMLISRVPNFGCIGDAEFEILVLGLVDIASRLGPMRCIALWILTAICCMTPLKAVQLLKLNEDGVTIGRTPPKGWEKFVDHAGLHLDTGPSIRYTPPPLITKWIASGEHLELSKDSHLTERLENLLKAIIPTGSIAKLMTYLLLQGPNTWRYSPVIPSLSIRGIGSRPGVFASYVRGNALFRSMGGLYKLIDPVWNPPPAKNNFGCSHVPGRVEVRRFYQAWLRLLLSETIPNQINEIRQRHNGIVAGLHLFGCVFLSGTRNYRGAPPYHSKNKGSFVVNMERFQPMPTPWSQFLREKLSIYYMTRKHLAEAAKRLGYTSPSPRSSAYCLWGENNQEVPIGSTGIFAALEDSAELARWKDLHPNALRALAMTLVYNSCNFHAHDIERFFGRCHTRLAPLAQHRLEPTLDHELHNLIEDYLRKRIRI